MYRIIEGTAEAEIEVKKSRFLAVVANCRSEEEARALIESVKKKHYDARHNCFAFRIGEEKTRNMQVHFSKIQYGAKGEIRHLTFADDVYGPDFEPFAEVIVKYGLTPHILSESAGTQAEDAARMRDTWRAAAKE